METVTEPAAPEMVPESDELANLENAAAEASAEAAAIAARKANVTLEGQDFSEFSAVPPNQTTHQDEAKVEAVDVSQVGSFHDALYDFEDEFQDAESNFSEELLEEDGDAPSHDVRSNKIEKEGATEHSAGNNKKIPAKDGLKALGSQRRVIKLNGILDDLHPDVWHKVKQAWSGFGNKLTRDLSRVAGVSIRTLSETVKISALNLSNVLNNRLETREEILAKGLKAATFVSGFDQVLHQYDTYSINETAINVAITERENGIRSLFEAAATSELLHKEKKIGIKGRKSLEQTDGESTLDHLIRLREENRPNDVLGTVQISVEDDITKLADTLSRMSTKSSLIGKFFGIFQGESSRVTARMTASATIDIALERGLESKAVSRLLTDEMAKTQGVVIPRNNGELALDYLVRLRATNIEANSASLRSGEIEPVDFHESAERSIKYDIKTLKGTLAKETKTSTPFQDVQRTLVAMARKSLPDDERNTFIENAKALKVVGNAWPLEGLRKLFESLKYADAAEFILNSNPDPQYYSTAIGGESIAQKTAQGILIQYDAPSVQEFTPVSNLVEADQKAENEI